MKTSVLIPVYNEKDNLPRLLDKIFNLNLNLEIIIVDDFSNDGTKEYLKALNDKRIRIVYHERNMGKGTAIRTGLKYATGDVIIIQDADLEYDPIDYYRLLKPIEEGITRVVYGSRILGNNKMSYYRYYWGGRFLSWLTNILYGTEITDEPTCYKVFKANTLKNMDLKCKRFEFCPEVTAKIAKLGYKIYEVPISYHPRSIEEGKKIRWYDGLNAIWTLIKYRFIN